MFSDRSNKKPPAGDKSSVSERHHGLLSNHNQVTEQITLSQWPYFSTIIAKSQSFLAENDIFDKIVNAYIIVSVYRCYNLVSAGILCYNDPHLRQQRLFLFFVSVFVYPLASFRDDRQTG